MCKSENVYHARHDSDWGGGNTFTPMNDQPDDDFEVDINTNYCRRCGFFGDFIDVEKKISSKNIVARWVNDIVIEHYLKINSVLNADCFHFCLNIINDPKSFLDKKYVRLSISDKPFDDDD